MKQNIDSNKLTKQQIRTISKLKKQGYIILDRKKDIVDDNFIVMKNTKEEIYINQNGEVI